MTASRARRTRSTWIALVATVVALLIAGGLAMAGARTLADSRAGRLADGQRDVLPEQRLPYTPTALIGAVDDDGRLTSVAVAVVEPDGTGGSLVAFAASADASSGTTTALAPLAAVLEVDGPDAFLGAVETLSSVSFDVVELVDAERFAELVAPLGDLPVSLPTMSYDSSTGERWEAGDDVLPGIDAGRLLTATAAAVPDPLFEPNRTAVWAAVADRVGAGIGSADPVASDADLPQPDTLGELLDRLYAGPVGFRGLPVRLVAADRVTDQLDETYAEAFGDDDPTVTVHDRAEVLMVVGSVAAGRVGAPLEAPSFRVVSGFDADELDAAGVRGADVLKSTIDTLLFSKVNVVSVAELPGAEVPDHTVFVVADPATVDGVREEYAGTFGDEMEVRAAEVLIEGVDIEVVLGRDYLSLMASGAADDVESSGTDANTSDDDE